MKILVTFVLTSLSLWAFSQPGLKFREREWDFGEVVEGTLPEHYFRLYNTGNEDLILSKVQASCGCTSPSWPKEAIAPGDSAEIKVVFNTRGYKNKDFIKSIVVYSNAVARGKVVTDALLIRGHVVGKNAVPQYPLQPSTLYWDFGYVLKGKKAKAKVRAVNKGDSTIVIDKLVLKKGYDIDYSFKPTTVLPGDSVEIKITFNTKLLDPGTYEDRLYMHTNLKDRSIRKLAIKGILLRIEVVDKQQLKEIKKKQQKLKNK